MKLKHNLFQLAVAFDQFLNVLVCMIIEPNSKHWTDETFSSHTYRHYRNGEWVWLYHLINKVFSFNKIIARKLMKVSNNVNTSLQS